VRGDAVVRTIASCPKNAIRDTERLEEVVLSVRGVRASFPRKTVVDLDSTRAVNRRDVETDRSAKQRRNVLLLDSERVAVDVYRR
jgi:hypothetical protein